MKIARFVTGAAGMMLCAAATVLNPSPAHAAEPKFQMPLECGHSGIVSPGVPVDSLPKLFLIDPKGAGAIVASADGTVTKKSHHQYIEIDHGGQWVTEYILGGPDKQGDDKPGKSAVSPGKKVKAGDRIGEVPGKLRYRQLHNGTAVQPKWDGQFLVSMTKDYKGEFTSKNCVLPPDKKPEKKECPLENPSCHTPSGPNTNPKPAVSCTGSLHSEKITAKGRPEAVLGFAEVYYNTADGGTNCAKLRLADRIVESRFASISLEFQGKPDTKVQDSGLYKDYAGAVSLKNAKGKCITVKYEVADDKGSLVKGELKDHFCRG